MPTAADGMPSAKDIFDFHPPGSKPDSWRQPFDIDVTDGPLKEDIRKSNAELRAYQASAINPASAENGRRCGEMGVALQKPGCSQRAQNVKAVRAHVPDAVP